jgi:hypothetical protein
MPGIDSPPGGAVMVEDVCDLQPRAAYGPSAMLGLAVSLCGGTLGGPTNDTREPRTLALFKQRLAC